ncbi:membrane protein [Thalassotalea insulae]|uniref:Membrane protein n=1 Tax=Thalassotalea insulae TaxID=2056778 RepID=A0ABQ6GRD6_9GAMM|nr:outer membrane beta-barrel protein [Thalassotalea insulae]GLX77977.1 membrane protein [Thalassotalea insulae]
MKFVNYMMATMIAFAGPTMVNAEQMKTQHSIGLQVGGGGLEYKGKDTDNQGVGTSYLYYNYQFMPGLYLEAGLLGAEDVEDWQCKNNAGGSLECFNDDTEHVELLADDFDFGSVIVALKGELKVSKRNAFYAKIGAEFYDYQFDLEREKIVDEDGTGIYAEAGWQYRWDAGIGLNAGFQMHNLGDLDMSTFNIGVSYLF